jgi:hypothetical protein
MSEAGPVYVPSLRPLSRLERSEMEGYDEVCCNLKCSMCPAPHRSRASHFRDWKGDCSRPNNQSPAQTPSPARNGRTSPRSRVALSWHGVLAVCCACW